VRGGYLTLGRWNGAPVRAHWTLPLGAWLFGQGRLAPGFWLGFVLLLLVHEIGHAVLVRRARCQIISIDVHALGGVCRWQGEATPIQRARIAWGGVLAQTLLFVAVAVVVELAGDPRSMFARDLVDAFVSANAVLILLNLIPIGPFDGAEAWKLPRLLIARHLARRRGN
jgi:stage IV sporulation protein FB